MSEEPPLEEEQFRMEPDANRWIGAAVAAACHGEGGAEPKGKDLDLLVSLGSSPVVIADGA